MTIVQCVFLFFMASGGLFMLAGAYAMSVMAYSLYRMEQKDKEKENASRKVSDQEGAERS